MKIAVIGLGFVGSSIVKSFKQKNINVIGYDKYKDGGIGSIEECLSTDINFLALPTQYNYDLGEYDKSAIIIVCNYLSKHNYTGLIVIKSTVEPETTENLCKLFPNLEFVHNPEFLTARTAFDDFHNQTHVVLGRSSQCSDKNYKKLIKLFETNYPNAEISLCSSLESESMKIFCNSFYAVKVQFFTELFSLCNKNGCNFKKVIKMMLKNNWINPMHTNVPGPDNKISYGGLCFPKDTNALSKYMEKLESPGQVLNATIAERNIMRDDHDNCNNLQIPVEKSTSGE